jgi:hypothetical protein
MELQRTSKDRNGQSAEVCAARQTGDREAVMCDGQSCAQSSWSE